MKPHQAFIDRLLNDPGFIARWGEASPEIAEAIASAVTAQAEINVRMIEECNKATGYKEDLTADELMVWAVTGANISPEGMRHISRILEEASSEPPEPVVTTGRSATKHQDGTKSNPFTHAVGNPDSRRYKWCLCGSCGQLAQCLPIMDFYGRNGEPLKCENCILIDSKFSAPESVVPSHKNTYLYTAVDRDGTNCSGMLEGTSKNDVIEQLRLKNLRPKTINLKT